MPSRLSILFLLAALLAHGIAAAPTDPEAATDGALAADAQTPPEHAETLRLATAILESQHELSGRIAVLENLVAEFARAAAAPPAEPVRLEELLREIQRHDRILREFVAQQPDQAWWESGFARLQQAHQNMAKTLAATHAEQRTRTGTGLWMFASASALAALIIVQLLIIHRLGKLRRMLPERLPAAADRTGAGQPQDLRAAIDRLEGICAAFGEHVAAASSRPPDSEGEAIPGLLREMEDRIRAGIGSLLKEAQPLPCTAPAPADDRQADTGAATAMPLALTGLLPGCLRTGGALAAWTPLLIGRGPAAPAAAAMFGSLVELNACLDDARTSLVRVAEVLYRLSERAYDWWYALEGEGFPCAAGDVEPPLTVGEVNARWLAEIKKACGNRWPELAIHAFYPDSRLDPDLMVKEEEFSGMRPTVARPLSWAIADTGGGKNKVLFRARVITH